MLCLTEVLNNASASLTLPCISDVMTWSMDIGVRILLSHKLKNQKLGFDQAVNHVTVTDFFERNCVSSNGMSQVYRQVPTFRQYAPADHGSQYAIVIGCLDAKGDG